MFKNRPVLHDPTHLKHGQIKALLFTIDNTLRDGAPHGRCLLNAMPAKPRGYLHVVKPGHQPEQRILVQSIVIIKPTPSTLDLAGLKRWDSLSECWPQMLLP